MTILQEKSSDSDFHTENEQGEYRGVPQEKKRD